MATILANNVNLYYEDSDPNNTEKPVLVFAHGLLWSVRLYDKQVSHLKAKYRCVAFDFRGQGHTEVTESGYDMDTLTDDAIALIEELGIKKCTFIGLSMGGFIAMRIAIKRPDLLNKMVLLETSADPEPEENVPKYNQIMMAMQQYGIKSITKNVMPIMFSQSFLNDSNRREEQLLWERHLSGNNLEGIVKATNAVITREGIYDKLSTISTPTLIIVGDEDVATRPDKAKKMQQGIVGSKLVLIPKAGHTSSVEEPVAINQAITEFLDN